MKLHEINPMDEARIKKIFEDETLKIVKSTFKEYFRIENPSETEVSFYDQWMDIWDDQVYRIYGKIHSRYQSIWQRERKDSKFESLWDRHDGGSPVDEKKIAGFLYQNYIRPMNDMI